MEGIDTYVPNFSNVLLCKENIINDNYILTTIEESVSVTSNPFICTLIAFYLKNNMNVILLSSYESLHHYSAILRKFGVNLNTSDKFCFMDLLYSPVKNIIQEELPLAESFPETYNPNRSKYYYINVGLTAEENLDFDVIVSNMEAQMKKFNSELRTVAIIDSISSLLVSEEILYNGVNSVIKFCSDNSISLVMSLCLELVDKEFSKYISNIADFEMVFKSNEGGFSKDIDGLITFYQKSYNRKEWTVRYCIKDNGISYFTHVVI